MKRTHRVIVSAVLIGVTVPASAGVALADEHARDGRDESHHKNHDDPDEEYDEDEDLDRCEQGTFERIPGIGSAPGILASDPECEE